ISTNARRRRELSRTRRAMNANRQSRRAAELVKTIAVSLHVWISCQRSQHALQHVRGVLVYWFDDAIVHPLSFAPRRNDARPPQVRQVAADLGLMRAQNFRKETHAHFVGPH